MEPTPNPPSPSFPLGGIHAADALLDALPWGILVLNEQRRISRINQQAAHWCGVQPEVVLNQLLPQADLPPVVRMALLRLLEPGQASSSEVFLPYQERWIALSVVEQPDGWVLYGQDISAQKRREQQYQTLAENTPDVLTRWTPDLRLHYANAAFAAKAGQPMNALLGRRFSEMGVPADVTEPYMVALQRVFSTGRPQEHYNPFPGPQGTLYYYSRMVPELRDGRVETVLGIARDITELRQTQGEALGLRDELAQRATDKYHALFHATDQGFCVLEVLFDAAGERAVDFRYLETNPAFAQQSGMPTDAQGHTARELVPDLDPFWFKTYGQVVRTGQAVRVEHHVPQMHRWFDAHAFRVGAPDAHQVAVLFTDITARKQAEEMLRASEQRQAYLLALSDALHPLTSPAAIQATATQALGQHLGVDHAYYIEVKETTPECLVVYDRTQPAALPGPVRHCPLTEWTMPGLLTGQAWVCPDVDTEPTLPDEQRAAYRRNNMRAAVVVPLLRQGQVAALVAVSQNVPRAWTAQEMALVQETAERTWAAVLPARAEEALVASEEKYRTLFTAMDEGFAMLELLPDESGQPVDFVYHDTNPAFVRHLGVDLRGKRHSTLFQQENKDLLLKKYANVLATGEPLHLEYNLQSLGNRWFQITAVRVGKAGSQHLGVLFRNITKRKRREANLAFLAELNADFEPLQRAEQIMAHVSERLAEYLHLSRCHLAVVNPDANQLEVIFDWRGDAERLPSLLGSHSISDYLTPAGQQHIGAGRPLVLTGQAPDALISAPLDVLAGLGFGSVIDIPYLNNGQWRFLLSVARAEPSDWQPDEVDLLQQLATRIYTRLERAQAEAALQEAHTQLVDVLESTHDAFYAVDAHFRFTYVNRRAAQLWGREPAALIGQLYWEQFPMAVGSEAYHQHHAVLQTGQPAHFETVSPILGTWLEVSIYPSRESGLSVFFRDITARKQAEERRAFLLQLSDVLRPLQEPAAIQRAAMEILGAHLGVSRAYYTDVQSDGDTMLTRAGYFKGAAAVTGSLRISAFHSGLQQVLAGGTTVVFHDVFSDPRLTEAGRASFRAVEVRAAIGVPLVKQGQLLAILTVHQATPRQWTAEEIALLEEVAERTWATVERASTEEALRASEQRLRAVMENLPGAAVFIVDPALRYQLAEGAALRQAGRTPADFLGRSVEELVSPEQWLDYQRLYGQALAGQSFEYEHEARGRTFATRGGPLHDADGAVVAVLAVSYDITARKQAEEALRLSEGRLQLALQAGRMGSFEWTSDGNHLSVSPMSAEVLGLLPEEPLTTSTSAAGFELVHPDDRARHQALFEQAGRTGNDFHSIYRVVRPRDGQVRWVEERGQGTRDPATGVVCLRGVHWDVTESVLAQQQLAEFNTQLEQQVAQRTQQLQESRDLLHAIAESQAAYITAFKAIRNEQGRIVDLEYIFVNSIAEQLGGGSSLVGRRFLDVFPEAEKASGFMELYRGVIETGARDDRELAYADSKIAGWFRSNATQLGDGVLVVGEDITARKHTEQERLRNLRLLEQAEAVAGLGSWDYELATGTMRWSDGMYHLFGLPLGSPVDLNSYLSMVTAEDRSRAAQLMQGLATSADDFEETLRLHVAGTLKTVRIKAVVLHDEQGQAARVLGVDLDITELQRLEHDNLRLRLRQQQALFEAVQSAQEAERRHMAESLHNGIGQILYATKLRLDQLHAPLLGANATLIAARREADQLLAEAIRQTRALSHELVPVVLAEFGLEAALQDISRKMSTPRLLLHSHVLLDQEATPLSPALQLALYRMAQELAQNIVKHARGTTEASLELETMPGWVLLRAEDNGPGFAAPPAASSGLGLRSIRDRVALLGGQLEMGSASSGGAYVRIRIPLLVPAF